MSNRRIKDAAPRFRILLSDRDPSVLGPGRRVLESSGYSVVTADTVTDALNFIFTHPIQCGVFDGGAPRNELSQVLVCLDQGNLFGRVPIILLFEDEGAATAWDWSGNPADDYLVRPVSDQELLCRVNLSIARARRDLNANPLTGLPGNHTIMREAERRLSRGMPFAMAYCDLDHFKSFNDRYGFSRGDEVLRMTARVLVNALSHFDARDTYLGHVGGDDFVFITPSAVMPQACERIIHDFDGIIQKFYDDDDCVRGGIECADRQGAIRQYPFVSCSIGVVRASPGHIKHLGDITTRLAQMKFYTKKVPGSHYVIDRRS